MFCPKCGAQNRLEQKYCRQCGHQLTGHRVALEGNYDLAATSLKKGEDWVGTGLIILGICAINIIANWLMGSNAVGILINLAIGLAVAAPFMIIGLKRIDRANNLLYPKDQPANKAIEESAVPAAQLPAAPITDHSISIPQVQPSVTEHTTLDLKASEQKSSSRRS